MSDSSDDLRDDDRRANEPAPAADDPEIQIAERRAFLLSLGKWSQAVIAGVLLGGVAASDAEARSWLNGRGGDWINRRGGSWINGDGGGWINRRGGGWINGDGGSWINRRGGRSWINRRD